MRMGILIRRAALVAAAVYVLGSTEVQADSSATVATASAPASSGPRWRMPSVALVGGAGSQTLPFEKTQLAQSKQKPTSMTSLASDSVTTQALQSGVGIATTQLASRMTSPAGAGMIQQAGSIFSGVLANRKYSTVTYVWGLAGPSSPTILQTTTPTFAVSYAKTPGVNPDDYAPQIIRLTPAQATCRLVGATEGRSDAQSDASADWEVYSGFLEERVTSTAQHAGRGDYHISPSSPLIPGEYAVVLRPISKTKKFSGAEMSREQGDWVMFEAIWSFQVSLDAE